MAEEWNASELEFTDISVEAVRSYYFACGKAIEIIEPTHLNVSAGGGHRIMTAGGEGFYIPAGFLAISWTPKTGKPTFVA